MRKIWLLIFLLFVLAAIPFSIKKIYAALDLSDKTSNGNNLTNVGGTEYTVSLPFSGVTESVALNGTSYLFAPSSPSLSISGDITLECWVKFDSLPPANGDLMPIMSKWNGGSANQRSYLFALYNNLGQLRLNLALDPDGTGTNTGGGGVDWTPTLGTWYHLAANHVASTTKTQFFVNGVQQGLDQTSSVGNFFVGNANFAIGASFADSTPLHFLAGKITQCRLWRVARTASQIAANYNQFIQPDYTNMAGYWPFQSVPVSSPTPTPTPGNGSCAPAFRRECQARCGF